MTRKPTPPRQPDCRLSNLVLEGGRSKCYRPKEHQGKCGEPLDQREDEARILYGRCGAPPMPTRVMYARETKR